MRQEEGCLCQNKKGHMKDEEVKWVQNAENDEETGAGGQLERHGVLGPPRGQGHGRGRSRELA